MFNILSKNDPQKPSAPPILASPPKPPAPPKPPKTAPPVSKPPKPKTPAPAHWEGLKTWAEGVEVEHYDGDWLMDELLRRQVMALYDVTAQFMDELQGAQDPALTAVCKRTNFRQAIYNRMTRARRAQR